MNEKQDKAIRKYVRDTYQFMAKTPIYETDVNGVRRLGTVCQRAFIRDIKRNIRKVK